MKRLLFQFFLLVIMILMVGCTTGTPDGDPTLEVSPTDQPTSAPTVTAEPTPVDTTPSENTVSFFAIPGQHDEFVFYNDCAQTSDGTYFTDCHRKMVYKIQVPETHRYGTITLHLANQYELAVSDDGNTYTVLASDLGQANSGTVLTVPLDDILTGTGILYVRVADADPSDGWGGMLMTDRAIEIYTAKNPLPDPMEVYMTKKISLPSGNTLCVFDLLPGSEAEALFIAKNNAALRKDGGNPYRVCDASASLVYCFTGKVGQTAYLAVTISQEYAIGFSENGTDWTVVQTSLTDSRAADTRAFDLTDWFSDSDTVYVRFTDSVPETGWGASITKLQYFTCSGKNATHLAETLNTGWSVKVGNGAFAAYCAGETVRVGAGETVEYTKEVSIPADWRIDETFAVSFGYIEGNFSQTTVTVNGDPAKLLTHCGNAQWIELPTDKEKVTLRVRVTYDSAGISGLWTDVRMGLYSLISYPVAERKLGDAVRKVVSETPDDIVTLNAYSGNYLSQLLDLSIGANHFNSNFSLGRYYVGDSARALISLADEERYSPIVRLDYIEQLYWGLVKAMIPTGNSRCFLKYDIRPKTLESVSGKPAVLWQTCQDVMEPVAEMSVLPEGKTATPVSTVPVEDGHYNGGFESTYQNDEGAVKAQYSWYNGTTDKATTATLQGDGVDLYTLRFDLSPNLKSYSFAADENGKLADVGKNDVYISPENDTFYLVSGTYWHSDAVIFTFSAEPVSITLHPSADGKRFETVDVVFNGEKAVTVSLLQIFDADTKLEYISYVADNMATDFTYGCNGYDPTYICDHSVGALAAGAYILQKYDLKGADEALELAEAALEECAEGITRDHYYPDYWNWCIAGCEYMALAEPETAKKWISLAEEWSVNFMKGQSADGSFLYLDTRAALALIRLHTMTGNAKYLRSLTAYYDSQTFSADSVLYRGTRYTSLSFSGAGDMAALSYLGRSDAYDVVYSIDRAGIDNTGFFDCSDLNPYFLGISLIKEMNVKYEVTDKKAAVYGGEYVVYDADGHYTITEEPTAFVANPYGY